MRRFPATSIGPDYTSVWHRDPKGLWTLYQDQPPSGGCSRYFGNALDRTVQTDTDIDWTGPSQFTVSIDSGDTLDWQIALESTPATMVLSRMGALMPERWWASSGVLGPMSFVAAMTLRAGRLRLGGSGTEWSTVCGESEAAMDDPGGPCTTRQARPRPGGSGRATGQSGRLLDPNPWLVRRPSSLP